jgi:transcriptional regulator with XRE-family HTH domain
MDALKKFRNEKQLSREQMAQILDISVSLYNKVEFDARTPSSNFLKRFKSAFPNFDMNIFFVNQQHKTCM